MPHNMYRLSVIISIKSIDIDECSEDIHRCDQHCHNTIGSYMCSCDTGFLLDSDGYTCNGENKTSIIKF